MSPDTTLKVKLGDYIVIQRQKYTKLQKFDNLDTLAGLGKDRLELGGILGQPYSATYKMCVKNTKPLKGRNQRIHTLELCSESEMRDIRQVLCISESGVDNRNIKDDGDSQSLGPKEIERLRDECNASSEIIEKIVENSKTFHEKTAYSQEKYLKKKEKKYFEFVRILRPSLRLITDIYYRQDPEKVMGIRVDTLSQLISYAGISAFGNYLLYESGTNGLLPASFLNSMGANTEAKLVHMHPGIASQKQAILALNLPNEQRDRCISVNIYSVLRQFYQSSKERTAKEEEEKNTENISDISDISELEPSNKKLKLNEDEGSCSLLKPIIKSTLNQQKWRLDNNKACELMEDKFDSLVIAPKEHPSNILQELLPFVKPSRPVVIFNLSKEVLMELYVELKSSARVTNLHLTSNWMRLYQVLPNRTHPEVNMNGNSGYLLCGYTIT